MLCFKPPIASSGLSVTFQFLFVRSFRGGEKERVGIGGGFGRVWLVGTVE